MAEFHCPFYSKRNIPRYENNGLNDFNSITNCGMCIHYIWDSLWGECSHKEDLLHIEEWNEDV
jgi:hypothetical protein